MELFEGFGLREMVIGTAVLLGVYSGIVIIRLARLSRPRPSGPVWKQDPARFGQQAVKSGIEAELAELRGEVATLKDELLLLQEEVRLLKAARNVSPQYGEAVALAQKGLDAPQIAERCGISVAEAEMVRALSRARRD